MIVIPAVLVTLGMSGCAGAETTPERGPASSAPSRPAPSATAEQEVATLVLSATSMDAVDASGKLVDSVDFSGSGDEAVAFVEEITGAEPDIAVVEPDHCSSGASVATWGAGFTLSYGFGAPAPTGLNMVVDMTEPALPGGVRVLTPSGFGVGDLESDLLASQPGVFTFRMGEGDLVYTSVHYDVGVGAPSPAGDYDVDPSAYWGASASATNGVIMQLSSPRTYIDAC